MATEAQGSRGTRHSDKIRVERLDLTDPYDIRQADCSPGEWGTYVPTKYALEAFAEARQQELAAYGVKVRGDRHRGLVPGFDREWCPENDKDGHSNNWQISVLRNPA